MKHKTAFLVSLGVGLICVLPKLFFIFSLGDDYRGLPLLQTPNENAYIAIMQEIREGHPLAASFPFLEYKESYPLLPPTIPFFYSAVSMMLHISIVATVLLSQFFLPALLFFLVYLLLSVLQGEPEGWRGKCNALMGGLLVTLGFDLVDYHLLGQIVANSASPDNFLIWTRPVNPIAGAVLLFFFLWCIYHLLATRRRVFIIPAGIALALMMASYVFSWTLALAVLGTLGLFALMRQEYAEFRSLGAVGLLGALLALPYWYMVFAVSRLPDYVDAAGRIGLLYTHAPVFNKFLLAVAALFALYSYFNRQFPLWWRFALALLLGGLIAYNQQVLTGIDIWHPHYVFYTIPLGFIVLALLLWYGVLPRFPRLWLGAVCGLMLASVFIAFYTQIKVYEKWVPYYRDFEGNAVFTEFLNTNAPLDCVVLQTTQTKLWQNLIPAFTHCNLYNSIEIESLIPRARLIHNYLVLLRLKGVTPETLPAYLHEHASESYDYLRFQIDRKTDTQFAELLTQLPERYRAFLMRDFRAELKKYRLDYILAITPLSPAVLRELRNPKPLVQRGDITLYDFSVVISAR